MAEQTLERHTVLGDGSQLTLRCFANGTVKLERTDPVPGLRLHVGDVLDLHLWLEEMCFEPGMVFDQPQTNEVPS